MLTSTSAVALPLYPGLKKRSIILMIALQVVTLGLYWPIWILLTRRGLNNLHADTKVGVVGSTVILVFHLSYVMLLVGLVDPLIFAAATGINPGLTPTIAVSGVATLILAFRIKHILEEHLSYRTGGRLSAVFTFVFWFFYLQHVINTRILVGVPSVAGTPGPRPQPTPIRA